MSQIDVKKFIEDSELAESSLQFSFDELAARGPVEMTDEEQAFVNERSIVSFTAGVSPGKRWDILDSVLFAQLVSDKKFDIHKDTFEWYSKYHEVLRTLGWVTESNVFSKRSFTSSVVEVQEEIIDILASAFGGVAIAPLVKTVLGSMRGLADDNGTILAFKKSVQKDEKGAFQIAYAHEHDGIISMFSGIFKIKAKTVLTQVLFFKFNNDLTDLSYNVSKQTLHDGNYASVREDVVNKLGDKRKKGIAELDI